MANTDEDTIVRHINYDENPYLSNTILKVINKLKASDPEEFEHIYEGVPKDDDDSVIIKRSWINAAIDAHLKLGWEAEGSKRIGFDIADDGGDKCVNVFAHGNVAQDLKWWKAKEDEIFESCEKAYANAVDYRGEIIYDSIGVGAGAGSNFKKINSEKDTEDPVIYSKFFADGEIIDPEKEYKHQVKNKDIFSNLKAQAWWLVADRFRKTWDAVTNGKEYPHDELISICSDISDLEKLITELSTPKKDYDGKGRVKVESKKDLREREIPSPDRADAFIMAFAPVSRRSKGFFDVLLAK